jgi:Glycosyl hydrolase family 26
VRPGGTPRTIAVALTVSAVASFSLAFTQPAGGRVALGAYIRGADANPGKIAAYARQVDRKAVIVGAYKDWGGQPFGRNELRSIWRTGAVPMITWEPWGFPMRGIARGRYDRYLRASARQAADWGKPFFLRFAHEMNGTWYPWGRHTRAVVYKAAWRHVVKVFRRAGARNAIWDWVPYVNPGGGLPFTGRFPGNRWVDWVGLDGLNWGGSFGWRSFKELFGGSYRVLKRLTAAPVMVAETGSGESGGSKVRWISRALRRQVPRMGHIRALLWWDASDPRGDIRVNSSHSALRALRSAARDRRYGAGRRALLRTPQLLGRAAMP